MSKTPSRRASQRTDRSMPSTPPHAMNLFRPASWHDVLASPREYVSHILMELGRLGLTIDDIENHSRHPNTQTVFSDLLDWMSAPPGQAMANLFNWQTLDLARMRARLEKDRSARPRIEVSAHITKMNNLSIRWHPDGWRRTTFDWDRTDHHYFNLITHRKWPEPPDFHWFTGDEESTFQSRPSNELMYIRGVGNLRPEPKNIYGPYATYNSDVVDSVLICAVRAAYNNLVIELGYNFEVHVVDAFEFVTRDEIDRRDPAPYRLSTHRVIAWSLVDAAELQARRERATATAQEERDRTELANVTATHGFTLETFVAALLHSAGKKATGPAPSGEHTNRSAAKGLRKAGFRVNAGDVRRIRELLERYNPGILPDEFRSASTESPDTKKQR